MVQIILNVYHDQLIFGDLGIEKTLERIKPLIDNIKIVMSSINYMGIDMGISYVEFCDLHSNVTLWNYKENGPDIWYKEFPQCAGKQQSPIDLDITKAQFNNDLKPINFNNYDQNLLWNITNDGKSIYGKMINPSVIPSINGSNYRETFNLIQFHFHWGFNPYQGSEHRLNGSKYPLEIHLVHQSESGNLAVIGFFYKLGQTNVKLKGIVDAAGKTIFKNDMIAMNLNLVHILPDFDEANKNGYFRYIGSLTIPPCTEGIIWTVYRQTVSISENQIIDLNIKTRNLKKIKIQKNMSSPLSSLGKNKKTPLFLPEMSSPTPTPKEPEKSFRIPFNSGYSQIPPKTTQSSLSTHENLLPIIRKNSIETPRAPLNYVPFKTNIDDSDLIDEVTTQMAVTNIKRHLPLNKSNATTSAPNDMELMQIM
ncbi:unnamed protein product, partial [Brachionus calyciflorus]